MFKVSNSGKLVYKDEELKTIWANSHITINSFYIIPRGTGFILHTDNGLYYGCLLLNNLLCQI